MLVVSRSVQTAHIARLLGQLGGWDLDLNDLLLRGCEWLSPYLKNNPNVREADCVVCDDALK